MPPEREGGHEAAIDQFWDEVAQGRAVGSDELDATDAATIRYLHAHDDRPSPDRLFMQRLWEDLMHATAISLPRDYGTARTDNGRSAPPALVAWPAIRGKPPGRGVLAPLATAALLLLTLVGSLFAFGPGRPGRQQETPVFLVAPSGTPATPSAEPAPLAEFLWSAEGSPDQPFGAPGYPAIDPQGNLWFTDGAHHRFVIFAPDGTYLESWGTAGSGEGEFNLAPGGEGLGAVAFDGAGTIYVADTGNARIQKFSPDRAFLATWGNRGDGDGQFRWPVAVAVDGQGRVFVSDFRNDTVQVFGSDGEWLATWARSGGDPGEVSRPSQLAVDSQGNLWVADQGNSRVQKFSPDGELLLSLGEFGFGTEDGEFLSPTGLAVDDQDRVFVSDRVVNRIQVFSSEGKFLGAWGESGREVGELYGAYGLALDGRGNAYVAEDEASRLQAFRLLPPLTP